MRRRRSPTTSWITGEKATTSRIFSILGLRALRSLDHSGPVLQSMEIGTLSVPNLKGSRDGALRNS